MAGDESRRRDGHRSRTGALADCAAGRGVPWRCRSIVALAALIPTVGDFGLTWDEPAYRYSQVMSAQWWEQLGQVRTPGSVGEPV